jgi:hypothetical protein
MVLLLLLLLMMMMPAGVELLGGLGPAPDRLPLLRRHHGALRIFTLRIFTQSNNSFLSDEKIVLYEALKLCCESIN